MGRPRLRLWLARPDPKTVIRHAGEQRDSRGTEARNRHQGCALGGVSEDRALPCHGWGQRCGDCGWGRWWSGGRAGACLEERRPDIALVYLTVQRVARAEQLAHCHLENRLPRLQQRKLPKHPADLLFRRLRHDAAPAAAAAGGGGGGTAAAAATAIATAASAKQYRKVGSDISLTPRPQRMLLGWLDGANYLRVTVTRWHGSHTGQGHREGGLRGAGGPLG